MIKPFRCLSVSSPITALVFSSFSDRLISACLDGKLIIWNARSWVEEASFFLDSQISWVCELSPNEIIVHCRDNHGIRRIFINRHEVGDLIPDRRPHLGFCKADYHTTLLATPERASDVQVRRVDDVGLVNVGDLRPDDNVGSTTALTFANSLNYILVAYEIGKVSMWNVTKQERVYTLDILESPFALDYDPSVCAGVIGGPNDELLSFEWNEDEHTISKLATRKIPTHGTADIKIRANSTSKIVCTGSWDSTIRMFSWHNPRKLKPLGALKFHEDTVDCVAISKLPIKLEGRRRFILAGGSKDGQISLWDVYNEN